MNMTTKFILNGGFNIENTVENNDEFYQIILENCQPNSKILLVFFAKEKDRWDEVSKRVIEDFRRNGFDDNFVFDIADETNFITQIQNTDIAYFSGGATLKLLETLRKFPGLKDELGGKVVAGESAGANVLARYCYSTKSDSVLEALGVLPIKIIPHYQEKYSRKLDDVGLDLELVLLPEYQTRILEIDQ
jgi:peptidase E